VHNNPIRYVDPTGHIANHYREIIAAAEIESGLEELGVRIRPVHAQQWVAPAAEASLLRGAYRCTVAPRYAGTRQATGARGTRGHR